MYFLLNYEPAKIGFFFLIPKKYFFCPIFYAMDYAFVFFLIV